MKCNFKPCRTCSLHCKEAKGQPPKDQPKIERLIQEQKIKEKGCPYDWFFWFSPVEILEFFYVQIYVKFVWIF